MRRVLVQEGRAGGQGVARHARVLLDVIRVVARSHPGQRVQRQPIAHRRITRDQVHALVAEEPGPGAPARPAGLDLVPGLQRQHIADRCLESLAEDAAQAHALELVVELGVERVDVDRQLAFAPQVVPAVLVTRGDEVGRQPELARQRLGEALRVLGRIAGRIALVGEAGLVVPDRLAVGAPVERQRPARQLLARVPLALAQMDEAAAAVLLAQATEQLGRVVALGGAERVGVPFGRVAVAGGDIGRLATHGQAHIARDQILVDLFAQRQDLLPLLVAVGPCHARRLVDTRDLHQVLELDLALVERAIDRRGARGLRRAGQRDMAFAGQQARGRVESDPARAGQEHLAPGVQVGEVDLGAARAVDGLDIGGQLDQVARDEARGQAELAQQLHQQPAGVAAGAAALGQRVLGRLHARLHPDRVRDVLLQLLVDADQEVDRALLLLVHLLEVGRQQRRQFGFDAVGREFGLQLGAVAEGEVLGAGLEEEVERVVHRHLDHQVDRDLELARRGREHQPRLVVRERVLLPVDEMLGRFYLLRVGQDLGAAVRRRTQPHDLGTEIDRAVIAVVRDVIQSNMDRHL